ncbi:hypothetical protein Lfu02_25760 [Longispora fulva]|uniref:DUF2785 domain-containing protein n=1 Tax=Longispora fulva TaxID=619741 RepID=A0A8J7KM36_9ACTN|nr:DUF2785 domain-containing protein [Longispora fulva]MBG6138711.1 hypothetical protein [Longispora fulva]GIG58204.1 hypothetical protein Lfu02_25760 [Longispora fulva]
MTNWQEVLDNDYAIPTDRPLSELIDELVELLRSPDPHVRDVLSYDILTEWVEHLDEPARVALGDTMATRMTDDPEIQARTFAPLILDCVVSEGTFRPEWLDAFIKWYPSESDLRGHHPELGWLHAVAHGADLLGAFGRSTAVDVDDLVTLLDVGIDRLLAPTAHVFDAQEDDRLAYALAIVLTRPELTEDEAVDWLEPCREAFSVRLRTGPSAQVSNTMRTLRMLYMFADRGVHLDGETAPVAIPHARAVKKALGAVLRMTFSRMG